MEHKKIAEMYGVLLLIRQEYEKTDKTIDYWEFNRMRVNELFEKAYEWIVEDERESNEKIAQ